jgi:L-alanine-DL-glutamate epimerase-like enolase superfamily enzyme
MKLSWEPYTLDLRHTWRIAHGASDQRHNVLAKIGDGEQAGIGEAAGVPHHGESQAGIIAYLERVMDQEWDPFQMEEQLSGLPPGSAAARGAIDLALHDALGKRLGQPLYRLLGLNPKRAPLTSYTISIDEPAVMAERAKAANMPILKIKLGATDDEAILSAIRQVHAGLLRVDANAGWSREKAAQIIPRLAQYDLEFVEQPLPMGDLEGLRWLRAQKLGVPIFADENILTSHDVAAHAGAVDGVVIKLAKTGGLRGALRAIHTARALDMQIMLGSMVETSLAVTAAAHLSPLCDYVDLDGPLMIRNDPFDGVRYDKARLVLPERPGLGVERKPTSSP